MSYDLGEGAEEGAEEGVSLIRAMFLRASASFPHYSRDAAPATVVSSRCA
jgi:hypothetical protein